LGRGGGGNPTEIGGGQTKKKSTQRLLNPFEGAFDKPKERRKPCKKVKKRIRLPKEYQGTVSKGVE